MSERKIVGQRQLQKRAKRTFEALEQDDLNECWLDDSVVLEDYDVCHVGSQASVSVDVPICAFVSHDSEIGGDNDMWDEEPSSPRVVIAPTKISEMFSDDSSSISESDSDPKIEPLVCRLRRWYCSSHVNLTQLQNLLKELRLDHPELPSDPRSIVCTPRTVNVKPLDNGGYIHIGLEQGLLRRCKSGIKSHSSQLGIDINVDGLSVSSSSSMEVWPILGRCVQLNDNRPFVIGLFCGAGKPHPLNVFLDDYINEARRLVQEGINFNGQSFNFFIRCYICDAPARAYLKSIKSHTGYNSCERCVQEGEYDGTKVCFESKQSALRTDESFDQAVDESHHTGISPLNILETKFITQFTLDSMHLVWEGVMKRFLMYLIQRSPSGAKLTAADTTRISSLLTTLVEYIPLEFARKPRSLSLFGRWKATELHLFLLYTGIVAFKPVLSDEMFSLFLLLHVAMRILSCEKLVEKKNYVNFAVELLQKFVEHCAHKSVFGPGFVSYNIHSVLHLCADVRNFGVVNNFSAFPFENHLGVIKRMVRSGYKVIQQLAKRLAEINFLYDLKDVPSSSFTASDYNEVEHDYKRLSNSYFSITSKTKDSFFLVQQGVARCKKIVKSEDGFVVIADLCDKIEDFFTYPMASRKVGVMKFSGWTQTNVSIQPSSIEGKLMVLPHGEDWIFPMSDLFVLLEFPPDEDGGKPQAAIAPTIWVLPEGKLCWWPHHCKTDVAIQKAISSQREPGTGYEKCTYSRILHHYDTYLEARNGLRKSEIMSDMESERENTARISSRGRKIKKKLISGSEGDGDDDSDQRPLKNAVRAPPMIHFEDSDSDGETVLKNLSCPKKGLPNKKTTPPSKTSLQKKVASPRKTSLKRKVASPKKTTPKKRVASSTITAPKKNVTASRELFPKEKVTSPRKTAKEQFTSKRPSPRRNVSPLERGKFHESRWDSSNNESEVSDSSSIFSKSSTRHYSDIENNDVLENEESSSRRKGDVGETHAENVEEAAREVSAPGKTSGLDVVKKTFQMVSIMRDTLTNHSVMITEILQRLRNKSIVLNRPDGMPEIPLESIDDAERMEESLASAACAEYLAIRLSNEGGATPAECMDRVMKKLMKRRVGGLYSFKGRKHKDAVFLVHRNANGKQIDIAIMDFLRYSPFRSNN